ncbi:MAG: glycoside hydrolase family 15 protein [Gemmatimonadota bacterium]
MDVTRTGERFRQPREQPYPPLREYAIVADCHGSALISLAGSVDWCCLGRFDGDPVLWSSAASWTGLTLHALSGIGYSGEARDFSTFLLRASQVTWPRLQVVYGIRGEAELKESSLDHLEGWRGSRPVRTGNGACLQEQLDVYGEVLDWAYLYRSTS